MVLESTYSSFEIGTLSGQIVADTKYGSLNVNKILSESTLVDLKSQRTPVLLVVQDGASFTTDITASGTMLDIPLEKNKFLNSSTVNRITKISGTWGTNQQSNSVLRVKTESGKLEIR
jgi:hypothetical protein